METNEQEETMASKTNRGRLLPELLCEETRTIRVFNLRSMSSEETQETRQRTNPIGSIIITAAIFCFAIASLTLFTGEGN